MHSKKLGNSHHCKKHTTDRVIYQSDFVNMSLFDTNTIAALKKLPIYNKKSLYSDVVKNRTHQPSCKSHPMKTNSHTCNVRHSRLNVHRDKIKKNVSFAGTVHKRSTSGFDSSVKAWVIHSRPQTCNL